MTGSDHELLAAYARQGSEEAFAELVRRHAGAVYAAAFRQTHQAPLAEEVMQAVFLRLAQKAGRLTSQTVVLGWLLRATRYAAIDAVRAESRRQENLATLAAMTPSDSTVQTEDATALWDRVAPVLDEALDQLRGPDRDVLVLRFFARQSLREVGAALGVAEEAARKRVTRALDRLRDELGRRGALAPAGMLPGLLMQEAAPMASPAVLKLATVPSPRAVHLAKRLGRQALLQQAVGWLGGSFLVGVLLVGTLMLARPTGITATAVVPASDYRIAGFPDAAVVHRQIAALQAALQNNDRVALARAIRFPLRINALAGSRTVSDETEFLANYEALLTPPVVAALMQAPDHGLFCDRLGVMVGAGTLWFGPLGDSAAPEARLIAINPP